MSHLIEKGEIFMYEERRESFSVRDLILQVLFIVLFVFILIWLFPTKSYLKKYVDKNSKNTTTTVVQQTGYDLDQLAVLYNQIFANNIATMKEAAVGYYTTERLPQNVGDTDTMTLQQMYDKHLVLTLKDKNGDACNATKSYVSVTKYEDEYQMKVNLSCGSEEDYIIVYLGCYDYCEAAGVCEKQTTTVTPSKPSTNKDKDTTVQKVVDVTINNYYENCDCETGHYCEAYKGKFYDVNGNEVSLEDYKKSCGLGDVQPEGHYCEAYNGNYYDINGNVVTLEEYQKSCGLLPPDPGKHTCEFYNGSYYDATGKVVTYEEYQKSCTQPEKHYCEYYNGSYYDATGKVVTYEEYQKSCSKPQNHYCEYFDGRYYDANGKVVTYEEYQKSCSKPQNHYCEYFDGRYYDANGKVVTYEEYQKSCNPPEHETKYYCEYKKVTNGSWGDYGEWSAWTTAKITSSENTQVQTDVRKEVTGYTTEKKQVGTKSVTYVSGYTVSKKLSGYTTEKKVTGYTTQKVVTGYTTQKVQTGTKKVQVGTTTKTVTKKVQKGETLVHVGTGSGPTVPSDTSTRQYKKTGSTTTQTCTGCAVTTIYTWEEYEVKPVYGVETTTEEVPVYGTEPVYETKQVPVYGTKQVPVYTAVKVPVYKEEKVPVYGVKHEPVYQEVKVPVYGVKTYYRSRTRTYKGGTVDVKWSTCDPVDKSLTSQGYYLTGNTKAYMDI